MIELLVLLFTILVLFGISFWLGYDTAESRYDHILRGARDHVRLAADQRLSLGTWITDHWPDAAAAYAHGWRDGYERGLIEAPPLREDFDQ